MDSARLCSNHQLMYVVSFNSSTQKNGTPQFSIEWYTSDTTVSIDYLRKNVVDVGITYHAVAEHTALEEKIIDRVEYLWRDHWMLVGTISVGISPLALITIVYLIQFVNTEIGRKR